MALPTINLQVGRDLPVVKQNAIPPYVNNYHGVMFVSDGFRYIYFFYGYGQSQVYRYDCVTDGFARIDDNSLTTTTMPSSSSYNGGMVYDKTRNRIWYTPGNGGTNFYYFDISTGKISPLLPILPTACSYGDMIGTPTWRNAGGNNNLLYYVSGVDRLFYRYWITSGEPLSSGKATAATSNTLTDTNRAWTVNALAGGTVNITAGTGIGQSKAIASNTANAITLVATFSPTPDTTSVYTITMTGTATAGAATTVTDSTKTFVTNALAYCRVVLTSGTGIGQERNILSNTATVITVDQAWGINPSTNTTYSIVATWAANNVSNNSWCGCSNALVGSVATNDYAGALSTANKMYWLDHWNINYVALLRGNGTRTVYLMDVSTGAYLGYLNIFCGGTLTTGSISAYDQETGWLYFVEGGTRNLQKTKLDLTYADITGTATSANNTSLTDTTKTMQNNIYGENYYITILTGSGAGQVRKIASNTVNSFTVVPNWTTNPGATSTYEVKFSVMEYGTAVVAGSTTSVLSDSTKNWITNQYVGTKVKIIAGTGIGQERFVTANTSTTLTVDAVWTTTDATSVYEIRGLKCMAEPVIQMNTSAGYYGNTMDIVKINELKFLYYWRKGSNMDWFRYLLWVQ